MIELLNKTALFVGYVVIAVAVVYVIFNGIDYEPVQGVKKLTFYDHGLVVINKQKIDSTLLDNLHKAGFTIWDIWYPYALAPSYVMWWKKWW